MIIHNKSMYWFHVSVHARPRSLQLGPLVPIRGLRLQTLAISPVVLGEPMGCSFETAQAKLNNLPRMLFEPDGSFVWVNDADGESPWQVDGVLYDRNGRLHSAEIKGSCSEEALDTLLCAMGWPGTDVIFQLSNEAVFVDEGEFRRMAACRQNDDV
ncbi:hypothetical protein ACYFX5_19240 [Bremerella sp. T1]|uniref:hypothetical protein n=1 Tax=Bremerella sp. TYQ1 TaxID=3119568 RepID=UPI001CCA0152|nr:hypothetical protein [Bremerella volcania]UBM35183.1 hypothetical protein LA756_21190 [Bremerella volcania]